MQNVIIGTAGHIDHGKTTLIKALTGRETDRLKEEKTRGISIDLGFTYFDLPSGRRAGIVDVPGHEKFVKNMLAGVGGIDIVLLVVAADEGVMPQTQEHLNILNLLQVERGIIALTKCDMVEEEWLELVKEDVQKAVADTFLKNAPIVPVSSTKKVGIENLIQKVDEMTMTISSRDESKPFRLPIDRVFSVTGFGTVVTGTLIEGTMEEGDNVMLYPTKQEAKVRSLQVHDENVKRARAGQRVAVNISNIKKDQVSRGDVLAPKASLQPTMMMDCKIKVLSQSPFPIRNRERVRVYHGTSEILARVVLLDQEELLPGQEGYAQLRMEDTGVAKPMDHFIIRFYSPMVTIGGGIVLDAYPPKRKKFKEEVIKELQLKEQGNPQDILLQFLRQHSKEFYTTHEIQQRTGIAIDEIEQSYPILRKEQKIISLEVGGEVYLFHQDFIQGLITSLQQYLEDFHQKYPLKAGVSKEEIRSRFFGNAKVKLVEEILQYIAQQDMIKINQETIALNGFTIQLNEEQKTIAQEIEKQFKEGGYNPPNAKNLLKDAKNQREYKQVFQALVEWNTLIKVTEDIYFYKESYQAATQKLYEYFKEQDNINIATFRDLLSTSRKYAVALLEYFDQEKITKRMGDIRVLNK